MSVASLHSASVERAWAASEALAAPLASEGGAIPAWIQLLPAGPNIKGRDGRKFALPDARAVVEAFRKDQKDIPIDFEHATEIKAPAGEPAPAAGWIVELDVRADGSLWGRVDWNGRGKEALASREYRYISPAFLHRNGTIIQIVSAGLTNRPNLTMTALNGAQKEEENMDKLRKMLGLPENATEEQVAAAITALQSAKTQAETALQAAQFATPSLEKYVPRADYDAALQRAATAEQKLATQAQAVRDQEIEQLIEQAKREGKISPATVEYHRAACKQEGGVERFKAFVKAAPVIVSDTKPAGATPATNDAQLSEDELAVCRNMALDPKEFLAAKQQATH